MARRAPGLRLPKINRKLPWQAQLCLLALGLLVAWLTKPVWLDDVTIQGVATVADGDTIRLGEQRIRFYGIDAPELGQRCRRANGQRFDCGQFVKAALTDKIAGQSVTCTQKSTDLYQRVVAVCRLDNGSDLNAWLVESGFAMVDPRYGSDYRAMESIARAKRIGLWAGDFDEPWAWRKRKR